jgi:hypothetical protein
VAAQLVAELCGAGAHELAIEVGVLVHGLVCGRWWTEGGRASTHEPGRRPAGREVYEGFIYLRTTQ